MADTSSTSHPGDRAFLVDRSDELFEHGERFTAGKDRALLLIRRMRSQRGAVDRCRDLLAEVAPGRDRRRGRHAEVEQALAAAWAQDRLRLVTPVPVLAPVGQRRPAAPEAPPSASSASAESTYQPADNAELGIAVEGGDEVLLEVRVEAEEGAVMASGIQVDPPPGVGSDVAIGAAP